jgi:hypothetical protein
MNRRTSQGIMRPVLPVDRMVSPVVVLSNANASGRGDNISDGLPANTDVAEIGLAWENEFPAGDNETITRCGNNTEPIASKNPPTFARTTEERKPRHWVVNVNPT